MDQNSEDQFILMCELLCNDTRRYSNEGIIRTLIDYFVNIKYLYRLKLKVYVVIEHY